MDQIQQQIQHAKKLFEKRSRIEAVHPYAEHIELFLSCISPQYAEETQKKLVEYQLARTKPELFIVPTSKVNFNWQTTDDAGDTIDGEKVLNDFGAKAIYGTLNSVYKNLFIFN